MSKLARFQELQTAYVLLRHRVSKNKIGYTGDEVSKMESDLKAESDFDSVLSEVTELMEVLTVEEIQAYNDNPKNKITLEIQKELAEKYIGKSITVQDYLEQ